MLSPTRVLFSFTFLRNFSETSRFADEIKNKKPTHARVHRLSSGWQCGTALHSRLRPCGSGFCKPGITASPLRKKNKAKHNSPPVSLPHHKCERN